MKKEFVCIVCPNGCRLTTEQNGSEITVSGNECPRGAAFAKSELTRPMRSVTGTVATAFADFPILPVKTEGEVPKENIMDVAAVLSGIVVDRRVSIGETVADGVFGTKIVATADMKEVAAPKRVKEDKNA